MSAQRLEPVAERVLHSLFGRAIVDPGRVARFVLFCAVGATGAVIDVALTIGLIQETTVHYLLANIAGFVLAVTWNFTGNWFWTYDRPDGRLAWQYVSYVGLHAATFGVRALVVTGIVEAAGASPEVATLIGVGVAALLNFGGTETVFGGAGEVWFDAVEGANHLAHVVYNSRIRRWLQATGVYNAIYGAYAWGIARSYPDVQRDIEVGGVTATVATEEPTEIVSVLHTLEKESAVLERFVADLQPSDHVLDVGANLGVFSTLAVAAGDRVTAVEPHPETAQRLGKNLARNAASGAVVNAALGDAEGVVRLQCERDDLGTQRPVVTEADDGMLVQQIRGDRLLSDDPPDVVKVDVEGGELGVLNGLDGCVDDVRVWYVEAHGEADAKQLETWFSDRGCSTERLTDGQEIHIRAN